MEIIGSIILAVYAYYVIVPDRNGHSLFPLAPAFGAEFHNSNAVKNENVIRRNTK